MIKFKTWFHSVHNFIKNLSLKKGKRIKHLSFCVCTKHNAFDPGLETTTLCVDLSRCVAQGSGVIFMNFYQSLDNI